MGRVLGDDPVLGLWRDADLLRAGQRYEPDIDALRLEVLSDFLMESAVWARERFPDVYAEVDRIVALTGGAPTGGRRPRKRRTFPRS